MLQNLLFPSKNPKNPMQRALNSYEQGLHAANARLQIWLRDNHYTYSRRELKAMNFFNFKDEDSIRKLRTFIDQDDYKQWQKYHFFDAVRPMLHSAVIQISSNTYIWYETKNINRDKKTFKIKTAIYSKDIADSWGCITIGTISERPKNRFYTYENEHNWILSVNYSKELIEATRQCDCKDDLCLKNLIDALQKDDYLYDRSEYLTEKAPSILSCIVLINHLIQTEDIQSMLLPEKDKLGRYAYQYENLSFYTYPKLLPDDTRARYQIPKSEPADTPVTPIQEKTPADKPMPLFTDTHIHQYQNGNSILLRNRRTKTGQS